MRDQLGRHHDALGTELWTILRRIRLNHLPQTRQYVRPRPHCLCRCLGPHLRRPPFLHPRLRPYLYVSRTRTRRMADMY